MTRHRTRSVRAAPGPDAALPALSRQLTQQRAQAQRAWKRYQAIDEKVDPAAAAAAHQLWSDLIDAALNTAEAISLAPTHDIQGLVAKFEAAWWWIAEDDNVLDTGTRRWLVRFGRNLRRLARSG